MRPYFLSSIKKQFIYYMTHLLVGHLGYITLFILSKMEPLEFFAFLKIFLILLQLLPSLYLVTVFLVLIFLYFYFTSPTFSQLIIFYHFKQVHFLWNFALPKTPMA